MASYWFKFIIPIDNTYTEASGDIQLKNRHETIHNSANFSIQDVLGCSEVQVLTQRSEERKFVDEEKAPKCDTRVCSWDARCQRCI